MFHGVVFNGEVVAIEFLASEEEEFATVIDLRWWRRGGCGIDREGVNPIRDADVTDMFSILCFVLVSVLFY